MSATGGVGTERTAHDFGELLAMHKDRLYVLALSILREQTEAEDAVQEVFIRTWRSWERVSTMPGAAAWLTTVTVNHCISRHRWLARRGLLFRLPLHDTIPTTHSGFPSDGRLAELDAGYRKLTLKQRAAVTLNYLYGYSAEECAQLMHCRPGTARSHIARALETLRREMADG